MNNVNLHALKSLSCFTAVTYYSTSHICGYECFLHEKTLSAFYYLSMIAKPLFFIIVGYIDEERKITSRYIFLKIKSIFLIVAFWNILFLFVDTSLFKQGYLLQNGILLTIAIIYICHPIVKKMLHNLITTSLAMMFLVVLSVLLHLSTASREAFYAIHLYDYYGIFISISYYLFGRILGGTRGQWLTKNHGMLWVARMGIAPAAFLLIMYEKFISNDMTGRPLPWYFLESLIILMLCLLLFVIFDNLIIRRAFIIKTVTFISPTMVGVYIIHYSVFYLLSTAYDINNVSLSFTLLVAVFMASVIVSRLLLLNKYTSQVISL
ncbi:acyltransferase family protein [Acerihabitans sp. TG2]|uniref:acyltransferase family protein n=1 Tax=Acerihabitans sp. TG2 TaxID=3096008 RepID=UPI002B238F38|nr:acyltransferase family protein [Acerihabitans sp. TG2]MEA9392239.1 acyltransferase family protein [Acerihabitans sp. TG2]